MSRVNEIFSKTQQGLDVFEHFLPEIGRKLGKPILSPLRKEENPSFNVFRDESSGIYLFKDFATDNNGNAIQFVQSLKNLSFEDACALIEGIFNLSKDLNPSKTSTQAPKQETKPLITQIQQINGLNYHYPYFLQYGITDDVLNLYMVKSVLSIVWKNQSQQEFSDMDPCFAYQGDFGIKVYKPYQEKQKFIWVKKANSDYVFGLNQLPDKGLYLFLVGGEKDVMTMNALGCSAICLNSETSKLKKELVDEMLKRFAAIIVMYDRDSTGEKQSKLLCNEHKQLVELRLQTDIEGKDISDLIASGFTKSDLFIDLYNAFDKHFKEFNVNTKRLSFDFNRPVTRPIPIIQLCGKSILSIGNLCVVVGKVKSGKSSFIYELLSASLNRYNEVNNAFGYEVNCLGRGSIILHFETEQSHYDWDNRIRKFITTIDLTHNFKSYNLLEEEPLKRLDFIIEKVKYFILAGYKIHLLAIDGIGDLTTGLNDEVASNDLVAKLHGLATRFNIPMLLVLHLNPDGNKSRGHLGSQLDRKAESVLVVERQLESDIKTISIKYARNTDFLAAPVNTFSWCEESEKHVFKGTLGQEHKDITETERFIDCIVDVFDRAEKPMMPKKEFIDGAMEFLSVSQTRIYALLKKMRGKMLIVEDGKFVRPSDDIKGKLAIHRSQD